MHYVVYSFLVKWSAESRVPGNVYISKPAAVRHNTLLINNCIYAVQHNARTPQWRHNDHDCVSNDQRFNCFHNRLFRRRSKKTSKIRAPVLCEGNPPVIRVVSLTKGQQRGKCSHLMTPSWIYIWLVLCRVLLWSATWWYPSIQSYDCPSSSEAILKNTGK